MSCYCASLLSYNSTHLWALMEKQATLLFFMIPIDVTFHLNILLNVYILLFFFLHYFTFQSIFPLHFAPIHQFSCLSRLVFQSFIISSLASKCYKSYFGSEFTISSLHCSSLSCCTFTVYSQCSWQKDHSRDNSAFSWKVSEPHSMVCRSW